MKQTIQFNDFYDAFMLIGPENFTYEGLQALFEYLEQYEEDTGEEMEFDPVAICCDFTQSEPDEIFQDYLSHGLSEDELEEYNSMDDDEKYTSVLEYLTENTFCFEVPDGSIIYQDF